jgi:hypothetical protein
MPVVVGQGPESYSPGAVLWLELPTDLIVGFAMEDPAGPPFSAAGVLRDALQHPIDGAARRPGRLRVADAGLARELVAAFGQAFDVVVGPTPELDAVLAAMAQDLGGEPEDRSYFEGAVPAAVVAGLFESACKFAELDAWALLGAAGPFRLDIPDHGHHGLCLTVIGGLGESRAILVFPSLAGLEAFGMASMMPPTGGRPVDVGTSWLGLNFVSAADLPDTMRREAMTHGWPLAGPDAYPEVDHRERDGFPRPTDPGDFLLLTTCARILTEFTRLHGNELALGYELGGTERYIIDGLEAWLTVPAEQTPGFSRKPGGTKGRTAKGKTARPPRQRKPKK